MTVDDAVGGNVYYATGASLTSPIPGADHLPIRIHAFFNAGNLANKAKGRVRKCSEDTQRFKLDLV